MVKKVSKQTRKKASETTGRRRLRELTDKEEQVIQRAACYCLQHFPMLWSTGGLPEQRSGDDGSRQWLIHVYLRYPTGHEGYLGDILYDGKQFTELTDRELMRQRAKQVAADPERMRKWNDYQASPLPADEG